jgi:uncharacterized oligopeptide transporter (OPT) family protein
MMTEPDRPSKPSDDKAATDECQDPKTGRALTARGICLAIILNVVYTLINSYLGLNFGLGLGFGIITVLVAYVLFQRGAGGSNRQEITTTMVASTGFVMYYLLSISIYIQAYIPDANLPWWLVPSQAVLLYGTMFDPAWIAPIIFHIGFVVGGTLLGIVIALAISDLVASRKKATFPFYMASGVTIDTCMKEGQETRFMFKWLGIGVALTFIQGVINLLVEPMGLSVTEWDFTPLLPLGFALGLMLNISLMAVSYIIDPKVSVTMLFAGIATYLVLTPLLVVTGQFIPFTAGQPPTGLNFYYNFLFQFALSPALGMMLLSGFVTLGINKLRARRKSAEQTPKLEDESAIPESLGFGEYTRGIFQGLERKPSLAASALTMVGFFVILTGVLEIFSPYPIGINILLALVFMVPMAIIDIFILIKFVGEAGLGMGLQRLAFYEVPLTTTGLVGFLPFLAYPRINSFGTTDLLGNLRIGQITKTPRRAILTAQLLKILPGSITSVLFVLAVWYFIGFPTEAFPGVGVLMGFAIVSVFATRGMGTGINLITLVGGGLLSGLFAAFTPISPLGMALALLLPPSYFIPFSVGGFLRIYSDRKLGRKWFQERGQIIAIGFIAGAAITQVIMSFL